jgi:hypothetical protein
MKSIYRKHLRDRFDVAMAMHFPEFAPLKLLLTKDQRREAVLFPGGRVYRRVVTNNVHVFINLIPHQSQEEFLLEVGWSTLGRFPYELTSTGIAIADGSEMEKSEWLTDFGSVFYRRFGRSHLGWEVWSCSVGADAPNFMQTFIQEDLAPVTEEQAISRVERAVAQCMTDIKDVVLPYFAEWNSIASSSLSGQVIEK